jgi:myo-inositol-1(or 4)-monophosphatase
MEAGTTVTNAFGAPLRFNSTKGEAFGVLATSPGIHAAAVARLAARATSAAVR